jgi:hypothetical protein
MVVMGRRKLSDAKVIVTARIFAGDRALLGALAAAKQRTLSHYIEVALVGHLQHECLAEPELFDRAFDSCRARLDPSVVDFFEGLRQTRKRS